MNETNGNSEHEKSKIIVAHKLLLHGIPENNITPEYKIAENGFRYLDLLISFPSIDKKWYIEILNTEGITKLIYKMKIIQRHYNPTNDTIIFYRNTEFFDKHLLKTTSNPSKHYFKKLRTPLSITNTIEREEWLENNIFSYRGKEYLFKEMNIQLWNEFNIDKRIEKLLHSNNRLKI